MPLPILLNRRTREQDGELYHTPWDGIAAAAYAYGTVGPYTAGMRHAALEALLHRYGHPEEQVLINLGSPIGKSLEMQLGFLGIPARLYGQRPVVRRERSTQRLSAVQPELAGSTQ